MQEVREFKCFKINGFAVLLGHALLVALGISMLVNGIIHQDPILWIPGIVCLALSVLTLFGYFPVQPNEARVLIFFGKYTGSTRESGFWWANPFAIKKKVSLRVRNFNSQKIKVNDATGNPIEIAAVVVWKVVESAKAVFDVDDYEQFVDIQSETAIRALATRYPYDPGENEDADTTLRGNPDAIAEEMRAEVQERLRVAGVEVIEARLTHLAYAPEIAQAMLRRQQAAAVVAARRLIVDAAVGMVQHALEDLTRHQLIELDNDKKAAMVNNLMVVLTGDHGASPVLNTGTLYGG